MQKQNVKSILMSIFVGACVAFLTTLVEGLTAFLRDNAVEIASGTSAALYHITRNIRIL